LEETIVIINEINQIEKIPKEKLAQKNIKIFAINYESHKKLEKIGMNHEIYDKFLTEQERDELFDFCTHSYEWFERNELSKKFCFQGINFFEIMDTGEFHEDLLKVSIEGTIIKKIIFNNKPKAIICSKQISDFIKINFPKIKLEINEIASKQFLIYEKIDLKFNLGKTPITIKISKNNYFKLKKYFEKITCSFYNLWYKKSSKQIILLTEFNPLIFKNLISTLSKDNYQIVFLNFRRPASWNLESINILKETNSKIIYAENFLRNENINELTKDFRTKLEKIFKEDDFHEIFKFNNISLWPLINSKLKNGFFERIPNYIKQILIIKNIINNLNLKCFITLNETGETEKILLKINNQKIKSILLLHGFHNFHKETEEICIKKDLMRTNLLKSDRFFVWGERDFQYYQKLGIEKSKIIITGSPKYDDFKINKNILNKEKTILITPEPITEYSGHRTIELAETYEKTIKNICNVINGFNNIRIIVKLHPGQNSHNESLKEIFNIIDKQIPVYQIKPTRELIDQCDLLLNITCESFDPSTIMLEGLILEKPVLEILLDGNKYSVSNNTINSISHEDNLKNHIQKMLFDDEFLKKNDLNRKHVLQNYLSYQTKASEKVLDYINNWN